MLVLLAYFFMSCAIAVSALIHAGVAGVYAFTGSLLFLTAGSGLKSMALYGDKAQKIGGTLIAIALAAAAYWLSEGFSVGLFGTPLSGPAWGGIGFMIGLIFAPRKLAGV